jgi:cellobiose phosphorylase
MSTIEQYGRFIETEGCFELTAEPPRKWRNLHYNQIGEHEVYAETSNVGDGPVWVRDALGRRCDLVGWDSKYLYIRDDESGEVFCPWGVPAPKPVENRSCRFYAAKTEIRGASNGLAATHRVFVPRELVCEAHTVTLENRTDRPRKISVFAYALFQLTGCDEEGGSIGKDNFAEVHPEIGGVFITNRSAFAPTERFKGYLITLNPDGEFVGGTGYRDHFTRSDFSYAAPKILFGWNADNRGGFGPDCCGLVQVRLAVPPNGQARADFLLGQAASPDEPKRLRAELTGETLDAMCDEQCAIETRRAGAFTVRTGNENYDALLNHFVKKQMYSYLINKSGFRDNLQIDNAICLFDPATAEENLLRALASQYADGAVPHGFRPLNRLQYADKPAWIMLTVPGLVYESGDLALLQKKAPFFESGEVGTVWEHMLRAMRFLAEDLGVNGLCNQHHADWNDGLEATREAGDRESVMVTQQLCYGLRQIETLARAIGDDGVAAEAAQRYDEFARRINDVAWDGEWYVRTICGDGYRIGSKDNREGKIFLNTQSWAILSGVAPADRAARCMAAVDEHLEADLGYRICCPPFSQYDPRVGRMSNSMPGHVENGGCYCHAAGFKGLADCLLGRAEPAWRTFVKTAPDSPQNPIPQSQVEPFSFTNSYTLVPLAYGRAGYPWRTGTAGWMVVLLLEWILGARRSLDGLRIDPCLSKRIPRAKVSRLFRGVRYNITLDNTAGRCAGATSITCDGQAVEGNVLPVFDGGEHEVNVVI